MPGASAGCCDRCTLLTRRGPRPGELPAGLASPAPEQSSRALAARRRLLKAAVSPRPPEAAPRRRLARARREADSPPAGLSGHARRGQRATFADVSQQPRSVTGTVLDVSPHVLVIGDAGYEQRFMMPPDARAWRGRQLEPSALRPGDNVVVRLDPGHRDVVDRIWANIGRVTGIITGRSGGTLSVDEGMIRGHQTIKLHPRALGRIQVRFPTLEPGYLIDIIGLRDGPELVGLIPATSQPTYPADRTPPPPLVGGHLGREIGGSATWHEPRGEPAGVLGVDYPALDPETGCAEAESESGRRGQPRLPYLAIGSVLRLRNECAGLECLVPVTGCASAGRLFNDRCVTCKTSPRGRIADLTLASYVALGGELERGCFNVTATMGE